MGKRYHITHHDDEWRLKGENSQRAVKTFDTKSEAQDYGRQVAINQQAELIIHGLNGKIQSSNSYGNDPCPPKDSK